MLSSDRIRGLTRFGKALNLIFPKLSSQNIVASTSQRFLVPVSTVSTRNAWHNDPPILTQKRQKCQGGTSRKNGWGCAARSLKKSAYPISDQNLWFSLPYFRPEALEPGAWPERVTSCYGTYTVVGANIKREMLLSPNDEKVANSSKKHTQFKTRGHKTIPYFIPTWSKLVPYFRPKRLKKHTLLRPTYNTHIAYIRDYSPPPPGAKNALQVMSLAAYASETKSTLTFSWLSPVPIASSTSFPALHRPTRILVPTKSLHGMLPLRNLVMFLWDRCYK